MVNELLYHCDGKILEWKWSTNSDKIPSPFWTSCFLIDRLLIDAAAPGSEEEFRTFLDNLEDERKVDQCFITHNHEDHCGCAWILQEEIKIPVYAGEKAIPLLKRKKNYPDYRRETWGHPYKPFEAQIIKNTINTSSNNYKFDLINTPGHAEELVCLLEKDQEWLFVQDAVMPKYTMIFSKNTDIPEDIQKIRDSIKLLHELTEGMDDLLIFTAGKGIIKGRSFLLEKIEEINSMHEKAHKLKIEAEKKGFNQKRRIKFVIKKLFGGESFVGKLTRGDLSNQSLVVSLLEWPLEE